MLYTAALLSSLLALTTTEQRHAWEAYRSYMTRLPDGVDRDGAFLDRVARSTLPDFGLELEFVAGGVGKIPCNYSVASFVELARYVANMDGVGLSHKHSESEALKPFNNGWCDPHIEFRDAKGGKWQIHSDFLVPTRHFREKKKDIAQMPGYEVTTPKLSSAAFALRLQLWLHAYEGLVVPFDCMLAGPMPRSACGALMAQPDRQRADWKTQCEKTDGMRGVNVINVPHLMLQPVYHTHVDGTGLCNAESSESGSCRGLINLILLHEKYEYVLRRMFPPHGYTDSTVNFRLAAPEMLRDLGALPRHERTMGSARRIFLKHEHQLRLSLCYLLPYHRSRDTATAARAETCAREMHVGVLWRWWSLKPFALIPGIDNFSSYKPTVECRSATMGPAYQSVLRTQVCRQTVWLAREMARDLGWDEVEDSQQPALTDIKDRVTKKGDLPWGAAVQRVTRQQMRAFVDLLHFEPRMRQLLWDHIDSLDEHKAPLV